LTVKVFTKTLFCCLRFSQNSFNQHGKRSVPSCEIRVVSFDLDNTLWNTSATIDRANDLLAQYINEQLFNVTSSVGIENNRTTIRVEMVMGKLFASNKAKYSPIEGKNAKSPVLLTQLRKDAIHYVLREYVLNCDESNTMDNAFVRNFVDAAFNVWMVARHEAISQYMTPSTSYLMEQILSLECSCNDRVIIGAITDGNSNPRLIPELSNVFDFYINAEMVGIGKPDKLIYMQAVKQVFQQYPMLLSDKIPTGFEAMTDDQVEQLIGPWWVHIGDDFVKDIVASNNLKMRNIWMRELLAPQKAEVTRTGQQPQPQPTRTVDELIQVINEKKVVEMSIGTDTYLADSIRNEFATAVVDQLRDVVNILRQWQNDALMPPHKVSESSMQQNVQDVSIAESIDPMVLSDFKFCIACGTKLPIVAKFCASCGFRIDNSE
jgi:FMN phosphatase YigB (HAD superfamily)